MERTETVYVIIRCKVKVVDDTAIDDVMDRVGTDGNYSITHEDDVCEIVDTELIEVSSQPGG